MAAEKQFERSAYDSYLRKLSEEEDGFRHSFRTAFFQAMHEELTGRQREVLLLYYLDQLTMQQVAERLDVNRSTVCRTLQRARERLYACLRYTL